MSTLTREQLSAATVAAAGNWTALHELASASNVTRLEVARRKVARKLHRLGASHDAIASLLGPWAAKVIHEAVNGIRRREVKP